MDYEVHTSACIGSALHQGDRPCLVIPACLVIPGVDEGSRVQRRRAWACGEPTVAALTFTFASLRIHHQDVPRTRGGQQHKTSRRVFKGAQRSQYTQARLIWWTEVDAASTPGLDPSSIRMRPIHAGSTLCSSSQVKNWLGPAYVAPSKILRSSDQSRP